MFTRLQKKQTIIVLVLSLFIFQPQIFAQKYSIDKQQETRKERKPIRLKYIFKKDATKAAQRKIKKDEKHKEKVMKNEQKAIDEYQKKANNDKESGQDRKVYTRMKKYEKQSERVRRNKTEKNFFEKLVSPKKKRIRKKEDPSKNRFHWFKALFSKKN